MKYIMGTLFAGAIVLTLTLSLYPAFHSNNPSITRVLSESGYTHIQLTGYRMMHPKHSGFYHTGFVATSPSGKTVTGRVDGSDLIGYTISLD